jgi:hypothetical protein
MGDFVILYKDGVASPPLHPVDATGWKNLGWTTAESGDKLTEQVPVVKPIATVDTVPPEGFVSPPVATPKIEEKKPVTQRPKG